MGNKPTRVPSSRSVTSTHSDSDVQFESINTTRSGLSVGDRVVWLYDRGDVFQATSSWEHGTVQWLGHIRNSHGLDEVCAGVEFDNPLDLGSGWHENVQIFTSQPKHGAFVKIDGLILERNLDNNLSAATRRLVVHGKEKEPAPAPAPASLATDPAPSPSSSSSSLLFSMVHKFMPLAVPTAATTITPWTPLKIIEHNQTCSPSPQAPVTETLGSSNGTRTSPSSSHCPPIIDCLDVTRKLSRKLKDEAHAGDDKRESTSKLYSSLRTGPTPTPAATSTPIDLGAGEGFDQKDDEYQLSGCKFPAGTASMPQPRRRPSPPQQRQQRSHIHIEAKRKPKPSSTSAVSYELPMTPLSWPEPTNAPEPELPEPVSQFVTLPWTHATYLQLDAYDLKGIQGDQNSCYIDSALFSLFAFAGLFDPLLIMELPAAAQEQGNALDAKRIQAQLRHIVNQLRRTQYVPREDVTRLRQSMSVLSPKFLGDEMDTQEFLQYIFQSVFHLPDFFRVIQNQNQQQEGDGDFFHQIILPEPEALEAMGQIPTVQQLLVASFNFQNLRLYGSRPPSPCFILQMPRSGNDYKAFAGILPNLVLDVSAIMEPQQQQQPKEPPPPSPCLLQLFAVICIELNHFVSFVRVPSGHGIANDPWLFFDSMANRNLPARSQYGGGEATLEPRIRKLPELGKWLDETRAFQDKNGPLPMTAVTELNSATFGPFKHLLKDVYMCFYSQ